MIFNIRSINDNAIIRTNPSDSSSIKTRLTDISTVYTATNMHGGFYHVKEVLGWVKVTDILVLGIVEDFDPDENDFEFGSGDTSIDTGEYVNPLDVIAGFKNTGMLFPGENVEVGVVNPDGSIVQIDLVRAINAICGAVNSFTSENFRLSSVAILENDLDIGLRDKINAIPNDTVASSESLGIIAIGDGLNIDELGKVSIVVPTASADILGGIKIGNAFNVDQDGVLSYTLPEATDLTIGGVKVGAGLEIDSNGVLSLSAPVVVDIKYVGDRLYKVYSDGTEKKI